MIAIVCDTPYQLMSAIMTASAIDPDQKLVFFINTFLYGKEQTFDYSVEHASIHSICYYGKKHMAASKLFFGLINPMGMLRHIEGFNSSLDISCIISSRTTYIATYLYNYCVKKNPACKLYLVEEGIGEYSSKLVPTRFTKACKLLHQKTHLDRASGAYFSAPELYPYQTGFPIHKVPALNQKSREIIEGMFNMQSIQKENILEKYPCIILSEPNTGDLKTQEDVLEYDRIEDSIMDATAEIAGQENTIIKVHPIDPNFKNDKIKTYYTKLPMESLLFNLDANQKIFLSPMSTAMLTPKLLFDQEPYLIFTYKMLEHLIKTYVTDEAVLNRYYAFVDDVIGLYSDKAKCAIPANMDELQQVLRDFTAKASNSK